MKKQLKNKSKKTIADIFVHPNHDIDRFYEIIFIVHPDCEVNKKTADVIKKYKDYFNKIEYSEEMGLRNLAFKIKKQITGYYFFMHVISNIDTINEFKKAIKLDKDILRFMVIRHKYNYEKLKDMATAKVKKSTFNKYADKNPDEAKKPEDKSAVETSKTPEIEVAKETKAETVKKEESVAKAEASATKKTADTTKEDTKTKESSDSKPTATASDKTSTSEE